MAPKYAKDQPAGFNNYIDQIAIVGVSLICMAPMPRGRNN
jgi:hypothetical protein